MSIFSFFPLELNFKKKFYKELLKNSTTDFFSRQLEASKKDALVCKLPTQFACKGIPYRELDTLWQESIYLMHSIYFTQKPVPPCDAAAATLAMAAGVFMGTRKGRKSNFQHDQRKVLLIKKQNKFCRIFRGGQTRSSADRCVG